MFNCKSTIKALLLIGGALGTFSCSNDEVLTFEFPDEETNKVLSFEIKTPVSDAVVVTRGNKVHEQSEWEVKSLNMYMFKKEDADEDADNNYTLLSVIENVTPTSGGDGTYSYVQEITDDMIGETVKVMMVANDKLQTGAIGTTTLEKMKESLASANLTGEVNADALVGNGSTGFPMSCMAVNGTENKFEIVATGLKLKGNLVRTVARMDIKNKTTNLTINAVKLTNAVNKSYLTAQNVWHTPEGMQRIIVNPTMAWSEKFEKGYAYDAITTDNNHLKHVLYMYEEGQKAAEHPIVEISYSVDFGNSFVKKGVMKVELTSKKDKDAEFFPARNTLYTIVLGGDKEGNPTPIEPNEGELKAHLEVVDWTTGDSVEGGLKPGSGDIIIAQ